MKQTKIFGAIMLVLLFSITSSFTIKNQNKNLSSANQNNPTSLAEMLESIDSKQPNKGITALPMENNGFIFYGYNIFTGNPHSTEGSIDPGFTNRIFDVSYSENILTGDLRFRIPDGTDFTKNVGCDISMSTAEIKDLYSYKNSLEAEISGEGTSGFASFSASASMSLVLEGTSSNENMFVESKAECRAFSGHIDYYRPPKFHPTFIRAIDFIDEYDFEKSKNEYFTFINYFGTHFIDSMEMGARYGFLEKTSIKNYTNGNFVSAAVSASASFVAGSASTKVSGQSDSKKSGSTNKNDVKAFSIGVPPPENGNPFTWAQKVVDEPMPIKYSVREIKEIFTNKLFDLSQFKSKNVTINIEKFRKNLDKAIKAYCPEYLKPRDMVRFCTEPEFIKSIETIKNEKQKAYIEDKAIFKIKNFYSEKCITFEGFDDYQKLQDCNQQNHENQRWKLLKKGIDIYKIVTDGPLSNGNWYYDRSEESLYNYQYKEKNENEALFKFVSNPDGTYYIQELTRTAYCLLPKKNYVSSDTCMKTEGKSERKWILIKQ